MDLLKKARARDEFACFAAAQADALLRAAYLMVGDRGEAEDIVQECMLRIARKWPRVRAMQHPGAYARRVMVSLVLDGSRRRLRRTLELAATGVAPRPGGGHAATEALDARTDLIRALGTLPARQRAVLVLRYFSDLPEAEVASVLRCSVGTVKSSASRALERLRQTLDESVAETNGARRQQPARRTVR
jgi:RNA polymerase sigma-70 factor (sigma-E family)